MANKGKARLWSHTELGHFLEKTYYMSTREWTNLSTWVVLSKK